MPRGDGTGPFGQGAGAGRGRGRSGISGDKPGSGPGGFCICPSCKERVPHKIGAPCNTRTCSKCGTKMTRE